MHYTKPGIYNPRSGKYLIYDYYCEPHNDKGDKQYVQQQNCIGSYDKENDESIHTTQKAIMRIWISSPL
jgi:hypothetical protein